MARVQQIAALAKHPKVPKGDGYITALMSMSDEQLADMELKAEEGALEPSEPWYKRLFSGLAAKKDDGMSDQDVRRALDQALRPQPGYMGVDAVYTADKKVVYMVMTGENIKSYRRGFSMENGEASLNGDPEEVRPVTKFEPVTAEASTDCGCGGKAPHAASAKDEENMTKQEMVKALIEHSGTPFGSEDEKVLMQFSEATLKGLTAAAEEPETPADPPADPPPPPPTPEPTTAKELTEEEILAKYPNIKKSVDGFKAAEANRRALVMKALEGQKAFTKEQLDAKSVDELEKLVALMGKKVEDIDYGGQGLPRAKVEGESNTAPEPVSLAEKIKAARAKSA